MADLAGLNQLHPGVFSNITSDQTVYKTATGVVTMFVADVFDKGPDGKIEFITTPSEFLFKYGNPNYERYGQSAYNVLNFLEAGGQAYVMRVLPMDATYAHSILNVQTRVVTEGKKVELDNGDTVNVDDVFIRPTVSVVKKNNLSLDMLELELLKDRSDEKTVDGFDNNFLLLVTPNGRGESYNELGYRLTPNDSFATLMDSRVYNFEVVKFNKDTSSAVVIEGPFFVTFDPDATTQNSESMFIEEVINKQSEYLNVKINLSNLEKLAKKINKEVKSTTIDVLSGGYYDEDKITKYNSITQRQEDIHLTVQRYDSAGRPVLKEGEPVINTPEPTDPVQTSLISLDNGIRENTYIQSNNKLEYMKDTFPTLSSDGFSEFKTKIDSIYNTEGEAPAGDLAKAVKNTTDSTNPDSAYSKYLTAYAAYESEDSDENLNTVNKFIGTITEGFRTKILDLSNQMSAAYSLVEHNSPNSGIIAKYNTDVQQVLDLLSRKDQINIFSTEHRSLIFDIQRDIFQYQLGNISGSTIEGMSNILNAVEVEMNRVHDDLISIAYLSKEIPEEIANKFSEDKATYPTSLKVVYLDALQLLEDIKNSIQSSNVTNREKIFSAANNICNELLEIINSVTVTANNSHITEVCTTCSTNVVSDVVAFASAIKTMIVTDSTYTEDAVRENARQQIQIEIAKVNNMGSKFFNTSLIDFNNTIKLLLGSDGSFEYESLISNLKRNDSIKRELIKAYKGAINLDVLNKDKVQFNVIFDARYDNDVKIAITDLARNVRKDFMFIANDSGPEYTISPQDAINWRQEKYNVSTEYAAIYGQDLTYYDTYTGRDIRFTQSYILASKLPQLSVSNGLHYPLAGIRRGSVDGYKAISWIPNEAYREKLYRNKINYIQQDSKSTRINSQLTTINSHGPLSYLNNMFTILEIKRGCEDLLVNYIFEFNDDETQATLYTELNNYLSKFVSNRSCELIESEITSTNYDISQGILKVTVRVKFNKVIERIALDINVSK